MKQEEMSLPRKSILEGLESLIISIKKGDGLSQIASSIRSLQYFCWYYDTLSNPKALKEPNNAN